MKLMWSLFPSQVSEREDKLLAEQMAKLTRENEEVSGDEDSEEEEDTGMGEIDVENSGHGITDWRLRLIPNSEDTLPILMQHSLYYRVDVYNFEFCQAFFFFFW